MSPSIYPVQVDAVEVVIVVTFVTIIVVAVNMACISVDWLFGKFAERLAAKTREENKVRDRFRRIRKYKRI